MIVSSWIIAVYGDSYADNMTDFCLGAANLCAQKLEQICIQKELDLYLNDNNTLGILANATGLPGDCLK